MPRKSAADLVSMGEMGAVKHIAAHKEIKGHEAAVDVATKKAVKAIKAEHKAIDKHIAADEKVVKPRRSRKTKVEVAEKVEVAAAAAPVAEAAAPVAKGRKARLTKGSEEAKAFMARIRGMRKSKA